MNKRKNIFMILGIILLIVILAISSYFFFKQVFDDNKLNKEFEEIQDIVTTEIVDKTNDEGKKDVIEIYINEGKTKYTCKECYNRHPKKESK